MKYFIKFVFFGLLLLGVTFTSDPILQTPHEIESEEAAVSQKGHNRFPIPKEIAEQYITVESKTEELRAIKDYYAGRDFNSSLYRSGDGPDEPAPIDTATIRAFDFSSDAKVNTPSLGQQFHPDVAIGDDGTIYVCWAEVDAYDQYRIYATRSPDDGETFYTATVAYGPSTKAVNRPSIAVSGTGSSAKVFIAFVYYDDYDGSEDFDKDVFLRYSTNAGASFPNAVSISSNGNYSDHPTVETDASGYVYVGYTYAWWTGGGCDDEDIEVNATLAVSNDGGGSWYGARYIASDSKDEYMPQFGIFGSGYSSTLHCVYTYDYDGGSGTDYDVMYRKVTNAGSSSPSIGAAVGISTYTYDEYPGGVDTDPSGNPQVAYTRNADVYYRKSSDGGTSFGTPTAVSTVAADEVDANMVTDGAGNPIIIWRDERTGYPDIYLSYSNDVGETFSEPIMVNQESGGHNQYWPSIASRKEPWTRHIAIVWWDDRWDAGDIVYNGNYQKGVRLNVTINPDYPPWDPMSFEYWSFDEEYEIEFNLPRTYNVWYDTDHSWSPLMEQYWSGSTPYERWACQNPGGWSVVPDIYLKPPDSGGEFDVDFYHQYNIVFWPERGNDSICDATMPDVGLDYTRFGTIHEETCSDSRIVNDWVDRFSDYNLQGWFALDPTQRWAGVSDDTIGTITESDTIRPLYFLQFKPLIHLFGPTDTNSVCTDLYYLYGEEIGECGLFDEWNEWVDCGSELDFSDSTENGWHAVDTTYFIPTSYFTTTIRYRNEEMVIIKNDFDEGGNINVDGHTVASPDTQLWGPASTHIIAAISPQEFGDSTRYYFSHWSDSGTFSHEITVPEHAITFTAYFTPHYHITLEYTGITGGHTPALTGDGWYETGTWAPISATAGYDSTSGIRYGFSHWSSIPEGAIFDEPTSPTTEVIVNRPYRIVANYNVQYSLEVINPDGYGYPDPPEGMNWFDVGSEVYLNAGSPDTIDHMYCTSFSGTGAVPTTGTTEEVTIRIDEPSTITWYWADQPMLTVVSPWSVPTPSVGNHWYDPGTFVEAFVLTPFDLGSAYRWVCTGYEGTSVIGSGSASEIGFIITENCTLTWLWQDEYKLTITNPGGYDSPMPPIGEHWYENGSEVSAWVTSPDGVMHCIGYTGSGSVYPTSGPRDSVTFTITAPTSIQWNWASTEEVVSLTIYSDYGDPEPSGSGWYVPGTPVTCEVTSPYYPAGMDGWRWNCTGFTGYGSAPSGSGSSTGSWTIWTDSEIHWNWEEEVRLSIDSDPPGIDSPTPPYGDHWYNPETFISGSVDAVFEDSMECNGYVGTGSFASDDTNYFEGTIDNPSDITWIWETDNVTLTVISEYDDASCDPDTGEHVFGSGTVVTATCDSAIYIAPWERYKCVGFRGTGGVPTGIGDSVTFVMVASGELTWLWEHQYRLEISNPDGHGTPEPDIGYHWFEAGELVTGRIYPNPDGEWYCTGYTGAGCLESEPGADEFAFIITGRAELEWLWTHASDILSLHVTSDYGDAHPSPGTHYFARDAVVEARMDTAIYYHASDNRHVCTGGTGAGSAPSSFADTSITFTLTENSSIHWNWEHQYELEILNPDGHGRPSPDVGSYWYSESTEVNCFNDREDGDFTCIGYYAVGSIGDGFGNFVDFMMTAPTTLTWRWTNSDDISTLTVTSDYGYPVPAVGVSYIPNGTLVRAYADSFVYLSSGERYRCTGFSGSGSVPSSGEDDVVEFIINEDSRLDWEWSQEYYLRMLYFNCGDATPLQTGENWYLAGSDADIWTEPSVSDPETFEMFGFMRWERIPSSIVVENIYHHPTTVTVSAPCTLIALYNEAVPCTINIDSSYSWTDIYADGVWYEDTHEEVFWWGIGSRHDIEVVESHDTLGTRYIFDNWSDSGARAHNIGPISGPDSWTASYRKQYALTLLKSPAQDYGELYFDTDTVYLSSSLTNWVDAGSTATIGCSSPDGTPGHRFIFDNWSDGLGRVHETATITEPETLTAYYNDEFLLKIIKDPVQFYGSITVDDSVFESVAEVNMWYPRDVVVDFKVSSMDIGPDSLWIFDHWNDDPLDDDSMKTITMDTTHTMTAHYNGELFVLEFRLSSTEWNLDTVDADTWTVIDESDMFRVTNFSTIPIDYGLSVVETTETWQSSCTNGYSRFVLRGQFSEDSTAAGPFSFSYDCVKPFHAWATDDIFGPAGYSVAPDERQFLWLEFGSPIYSSLFDNEETVIMKIDIRPRTE
ncbi:MAG: sialidase family protein [Candidatus Zixiibacteriota bacterium]